MDANQLTLVESAKLENYEVVIEAGLKNFVDVGRALMGIRDGRLYRSAHDTFENYCKERWGLVRQHANRIIAAAEVVRVLEPIGSISVNESTVRPLTKLPEPEQKAVWQEAVATAPAGKVTARHVEKVVAEHKERQQPKYPKRATELIERGKEFDEKCRLLEAVSQWAEAASQQPHGVNLDRKAVIDLIGEAKLLIRQARPSAICKACKGRGCDQCDKRGVTFGLKLRA